MPIPSPQNQSSQHRVAITGAGIITSMGIGWAENAEGFRAGRMALRDITVFDSSKQRVHRAGEVVFDKPLPKNQLNARQLVRLDRASRMLVYAGQEALQQSGWTAEELASNPIPICLGTSAGAMAIGESYYKSKISKPGKTRGLAEKVMLYQPHTQAQFLMDSLGVQGPLTIITNACASGANAIGHAFHLIKKGRATRAIAGGYDALAEMVFAGFDSLQALSTTTPRPFDANRDGLALGEGAAILMLERYEDAVARGATILAEVVGYGASTDLHHLTQPHPQGDAALLSMTRACEEAQLSAADIQYINSHGTGTPLNDVAEGMAIQRWAGDHVSKLMVSSTKANIGHLLGGAGAVETVICLLAMQGGFVPPTPTIETLDPVCTFDLVREPRAAELDCVLTNSFGFGGANATLILKASKHQGAATAAASLTPSSFMISGWGAVSPAGWSANALTEAVNTHSPLPYQTEQRVEESPQRRIRTVPALTDIPLWMKQPRFRRTTAVARHAVHAAAEALGAERLALVQSGALRVGVIFCSMNGCVQFSRRFFAEVQENPMFASPILFPETVYNAPSSHLAALLGSSDINYTLVGDSAQFVRGIELATQWLEDGIVEGCLVVAAEEIDWVSDEALMLFGKNTVAAEGAAAVFLERGLRHEAKGMRKVKLERVTEALTFGNGMPREKAALMIRNEFRPPETANVLLCDGLGSGERADRAELGAWKDWQGPRESVRKILGEGFSVASGWQTVVACQALQSGQCDEAIVNAVGLSEQAVGMLLKV